MNAAAAALSLSLHMAQPAAMPAPPHVDLVATVGRVQCIEPGGSGIVHFATGWAVGSADTIVTAAHTFFADRHGATETPLGPQDCSFVTLNADNSVRSEYRIRYILSDWSSDKRRHDSSYDVAVVKLEKASDAPIVPMPPARPDVRDARVQLVALESDAAAVRRPQVTQGIIEKFPKAYAVRDARGFGASEDGRLFGASARSAPGSSGGLYVSSRDGTPVGIHIGRLCPDPDNFTDYAVGVCFNVGIWFDDHIAREVRSVVADNPPRAALIGRQIS